MECLDGLAIYPHSVVETDSSTYFLVRRGSLGDKLLGVRGRADGFDGTPSSESGALLCPLSPDNAALLRVRLPWLRPVPLGVRTSAGLGDRLGLATPGHTRAAQGTGILPVFAQQSVRENDRSRRTPQQVLDDAMWGLFEVGWREPWGADADHLKTFEDVDSFIAVGYSTYTVDPGAYVDNSAHTSPSSEIEAKVQALPWAGLEDSTLDMERRYLGQSFDIGEVALRFDAETLWRAAAKYAGAVAHPARMYRHLAGQMGETSFELEVSVDETATPTSPAEHLFIANELRRLGVQWVSLAPRYVGRFEKGVDYIGDLGTFEAEFIQHAAIARALGPYKLSIHSGSDKFSIYPIVARHTRRLAHLKTAGTSYLEALRTVAGAAPDLFREILALSRTYYDADRATYIVSAQLTNVPVPELLTDADLPGLLDQFDARQVLHVTFGSVMDRLGERLLRTLQENEEAYYAVLESHFDRHLSPFIE